MNQPRPPAPPARPRAPAFPNALRPGARLDEYEIERVIEASGFSISYLATDHALERLVLLEEYLPGLLATRADDGLAVTLRADAHDDAYERGLRAFVDEARWLARCDHPNLMRVYRLMRANGTAYRDMPPYRGTRLGELRDEMPEPPDETALRALALPLLGALEALHATQQVHGAISPDSIVLLPDDQPLLMGFDAARRAVVGDRAQALMSLVEPAYTPPELHRPSASLPIGPWTDLYALAAVMRYCIEGRPGPTARGTAPESLDAAIRRLAARYPGMHYSPGLVSAIEWAMAPRPEDRPVNVAAFRAALDGRAAPPVAAPAASSAAAEVAEAPAVAAAPAFVVAAHPPPIPEPLPEPDPDATVLQARPPVASLAPRHLEPALEPEAAPAEAQQAGDDAPADESTEVIVRAMVDQALAAASRPAPGRPEPGLDAALLAAMPGPDAAVPAAPVAVPLPGRKLRYAVMAGMVVALAAGAWVLVREESTGYWLQTMAQSTGLGSGAARPSSAPAKVADSEPAAPALELPQAPPAAGAPASASVAAPDPEPVPAPIVASTAPEPAPQSPSAAAAPSPARKPTKPAEPARLSAAAPATPREACASRTDFALYYCMQTQCKKPDWMHHPQCDRLRETDSVE